MTSILSVWLLLLTAATSAVTAQGLVTEVTACVGIVAPDADGDGMSDACELELAQSFAPVLTVRSGLCNWDSAAGRLGGGYFYAVQPFGSTVRVAYLPAYFRDCGWTGLKCLLPWIDCSPHAGDSEIVVLELQRGDGNTGWGVVGVFLSAHCFGRSSRSCRWYRGVELAKFEWDASAPVIWVAEGRNANYPSWRACDEGHHSVDTCDNHDTRYRFPIDIRRNIGSREAPIRGTGCIPGSELESGAVSAAAVECFWRVDTPFKGWQLDATGVTPYEKYLREVASF